MIFKRSLISCSILPTLNVHFCCIGLTLYFNSNPQLNNISANSNFETLYPLWITALQVDPLQKALTNKKIGCVFFQIALAAEIFGSMPQIKQLRF